MLLVYAFNILGNALRDVLDCTAATNSSLQYKFFTYFAVYILTGIYYEEIC